MIDVIPFCKKVFSPLFSNARTLTSLVSLSSLLFPRSSELSFRAMLLARGAGARASQGAPRHIGIAATQRRQQSPKAAKRSSIAAAAAGGGGGGRLFSALDDDLKHSPGSVLDAAALVAGTTIGAGVLAIPAVTEPAGFGAAAPALVGAWAFSVASGLLLAEASLWFLCSTGRGGGSLLSLTRAYLGPGPSRVAGFCYVFLHEALLVAYISRGAEVIAEAVRSAFPSLTLSGSSASSEFLLLPLSAALFTAVLGSACYVLPARKLDEANSVLVAGVVASFVALLAVALTAAPPSGAGAAADPSSAAAGGGGPPPRLCLLRPRPRRALEGGLGPAAPRPARARPGLRVPEHGLRRRVEPRE